MNITKLISLGMSGAMGLLVMASCAGTDADGLGKLNAAAEVDPQPDKMLICHVPGGDMNKARTLRIAKAAVEAHLRQHQGDAVGPCASDQPPACKPDSELEENLNDADIEEDVDENADQAPAEEQAGEAVAKERGKSAERSKGRAHFAGRGVEKVAICHLPPGNPSNARTIVVGAPAVPAHLAKGSYLGPCSWACDTDDNGDIPEVGEDNGANDDDADDADDADDDAADDDAGDDDADAPKLGDGLK